MQYSNTSANKVNHFGVFLRPKGSTLCNIPYKAGHDHHSLPGRTRQFLVPRTKMYLLGECFFRKAPIGDLTNDWEGGCESGATLRPFNKIFCNGALHGGCMLGG